MKPGRPALSWCRGVVRAGLLCTLAACTSDGPLFPEIAKGDVVLVPGAANGSLTFLEVRTGRMQRVFKEDWFSVHALAADGRTVYGKVFYAQRNEPVHEELVVVDVPSGSVRWRLRMREGRVPRVIDGIGLYGGDNVGVSHDGRTAYVGYGQVDSVFGIAAVDAATQRPIAFSGPWNLGVNAFTSLPPSVAYPEGALLVLGLPRPLGQPDPPDPPDAPLRAPAYMLHPRSLARLDSISADAVGGQGVWQVVQTPDPHTLYLAGPRDLMRLDLPTKAVTASVPRPSQSGSVTYVPGLRQVVLTSGSGGFQMAGSGLVHVYTEDLRPIGTIDAKQQLGSPSLTIVHGMPAADGRHVYLRSGFTGGAQIEPARLLVVDLVQRRLTGAILLGGPASSGRIYRAEP